MSLWDKEDWLFSAKRILSWIVNLDSSQPVLLLLRHSHRDTLKNQEDMLGGGLTDLGKEVSVEMGKRLPTSRRAHFFFSIVPRCYETAEALAQGFSEMGGEVIDMDPLPTLVRPEYTNQDVWKNLQPNGENVTDFVNRWADDEFEGIEDFNNFQKRLREDTVGRLRIAKEPVMHVHITHDLSLMAAKRMLFNRPLVWEDREPYLGGIGITVRENNPILFVKGEEMRLKNE